MNEASKKAWLAAVLSGASLSPNKQGAVGSSKKSTKSAVQVAVGPKGSRDTGGSSKVNSSGGSAVSGQSSRGIAGALGRMGRSFFGTPNSKETRDKPPVGEHRRSSKSNAVVAVDTVGDSSGGDPQRRNSRENDDLDASGTGTGSGKPRRSSKDNNMYLEPSAGSGGRVRRKSMDREPGQDSSKASSTGRVKIATLTMDAIQQIDEVTPIEAWQRQPVGSQGRRRSKVEGELLPAGSARVGAGAGLGIAISTKASVNPQPLHAHVHNNTWVAGNTAEGAGGVGVGGNNNPNTTTLSRKMSMY